MRVSLLLLASALLLQLVYGSVVPPSHYPSDVAALMNFSADPCQDFYSYACGTWIAETKLPPTEPVLYHAITNIELNNVRILVEILDSGNNSYPKIGDFYDNCMDLQTIEQLSTGPFMKYYSKLASVQSVDDVMEAVGYLHSIGSSGLFEFSAVTDPGNPVVVIPEIDQGGYVLPSRDMYNVSTSQSLLDDYLLHINTMFALLHNESPEDFSDVVELEIKIAMANLPIDDIRDPLTVYNPMTFKQLQSLTPGIPWKPYFAAIGWFDADMKINIAEPVFMKSLAQIITNADISTLKKYLQWNLLHSAADLMPMAFVNETFNFFGKELSGQDEQSPRNETCVQATDAALGNILGKAFIDKAFTGQSEETVTKMIAEIIVAFNNTLLSLPWMDPQTKAQAILKLSEVTQRIGYPKNPSYYPSYEVQKGQFLMSTFAKQFYDFNETISTIGNPPDRSKWLMTADTVNAYYEPTDNSINFPAGIMQNPYFSISRELPENYGGVGVIMGHELTHGFDDQGRMYDGHGKLSNWWQNSTLEHYENSTKCMVKQYSSFEVLPGVYVNGNQTLGENIADNGGVLNAYNAYTSHVGVDNADYPLHFVAYAQGWCAKATEQYAKLQVQTDVHSPAKFRVIGPLMNFDAFAKTFSCPLGSTMNPTTKCVVW
eukprot:CAMPEP_0174257170 /NCGR_PEP_ID=MMETSP0439-20130205/6331_1 /TAXON_ID=0 /ORGANISM="Stereomyxa ramosa, Strain Chinc5" /LENGTH=657 /DNA_ID=CAMNT_0015340135 /DNA_START=66 /DNA_END=2039 /DNA_ORIENTATION=-